MLPRQTVLEALERYDARNLTVGALGSHSALDVADGAADEGFRTLVVAQKGRERTYERYFAARRDGRGKLVRGFIDETLTLAKFGNVMEDAVQERLLQMSTLWIPNRSFTVYCGIDNVEDKWRVPIMGNRAMLRTEERTEQRDYYWLLEKAGLPFPEKINDPRDIQELSIVKLHHAKKKLERGFFTAASYKEYQEKSEELLRNGVIDQESLDKARIERYVIGPVFNFNFFHSPLARHFREEPVELLGVDWRFESSLDGHVRLPAAQQLALQGKQRVPEMNVVGHNTATVRESLLEDAFALAEKFVAAAKEHYAPGVIGPFCLQTCVDKDLKFYIYDVAPRIGGGTNVHVGVGHPYGNALWRQPTSTGRRIAMEIRRAVELDRLADIVT
ncbi:MAG TPA: formate--phosphoribosylaminoimidazolecarboxamide ligase family protein [Candidatus Thermoplasmatota archaeon]|nr:formate--phosphoribosylaminoimidazolecarboxamide ligase family protein [Candidatus Thermoplasmatota archaeon]